MDNHCLPSCLLALCSFPFFKIITRSRPVVCPSPPLHHFPLSQPFLLLRNEEPTYLQKVCVGSGCKESTPSYTARAREP